MEWISDARFWKNRFCNERKDNFDGRNLYEIKEMKKFGFHYECRQAGGEKDLR